jgi:NAD(P)-dependent dehydrogenase (short-subunit alcohol dehydrogenase family)
VWLVTGSASGIGQAVTGAVRADGFTVEGLDIAAVPSGSSPHIRCDVANAADVDRAVSEVLDRHGAVDVLVNSAGIHRPGTVATTSVADWNAILAVNLRGAYLVSRAVLPAMIRQGRGSIVHIASVAGLVGGRDSAAYIASKGGLIALTKAMAVDHAPQGVRVNCVCPGMIETPMLAATDQGMSNVTRRNVHRDRIARHPLGRLGSAADVAAAVRYLAGDDAGWVTGSVLTVDGGYTAQ